MTKIFNYKHMKIFVIIFFFISYFVFGQVEYSRGVLTIGDYPGFYIDAANYRGDKPDMTRLDVFLQIPYKNLQFVKKSGKFLAKYTVTLSFYDEDKDKLLLEKIWNAKISASSFEAASSENNFNYDHRSFDLKPDTYLMQCNLYDKDSKKDYTVQAKIELKELNKKLAFSDIIFIKSEIDISSQPLVL